MKKNVYIYAFLAQRLDNKDFDHMEFGHRSLTEKNMDERLKLDSKISNISLDGIQIFSDRYHTLFLLNDEFLLKTPSDQLDNAGRIAPIITYGYVPHGVPQSSWPNDVVAALTDFAGRIGRTICKENQEIAQRAMQYVVNKKRQSLFRKLSWIGFGVIIFCIIYWLVFNKN